MSQDYKIYEVKYPHRVAASQIITKYISYLLPYRDYNTLARDIRLGNVPEAMDAMNQRIDLEALRLNYLAFMFGLSNFDFDFPRESDLLAIDPLEFIDFSDIEYYRDGFPLVSDGADEHGRPSWFLNVRYRLSHSPDPSIPSYPVLSLDMSSEPVPSFTILFDSVYFYEWRFNLWRNSIFLGKLDDGVIAFFIWPNQ